MACATRFPKVRYHSEHCNERTWMCYHQVPPLARVVAHVGDAGQAKPHLEHNPFSLLRACHATPIRKLNDPGTAHAFLAILAGRPWVVVTVPALVLRARWFGWSRESATVSLVTGPS